MSIHKKIRDGRKRLEMTEQQFADAIGVSRGSVQQWEKEGGTAPTRKNQPKVAQLLGLSVAELMDDQSTVVEISSARNQKNKSDEFVIPQFNTGGSMGRGLILRDQPGVIRGWTVNQEWVAKNIKSHTGAENLCIVTGFGDSMKGMFNSGDPLVVDRGVTSVEYDAVYFFRVSDITSERVLLQVESAVFKDGNKWRLSDGSSTFYATIGDDEFLERVEAGSERFGKGDLLVVNLRRVQTITDAGLKTDVTVARVLEHKAPLQPPLL